MTTTYCIEYWDPVYKKYRIGWEGSKLYAERMMYKSYNRIHTRRLVRLTREVLLKEKGKKK